MKSLPSTAERARPPALYALSRLGATVVLTAALVAGGGARATEPAAAQAAAAPFVQDALGRLLGELRERRLAPATDDELSRRACQALLDAFATGGAVVGAAPNDAATDASRTPLAGVETLSGRFGYLRIGRVDRGLQEALTSARSQMPESAEGGTVVDLRDGAGNDLDAARQSAATLGSWGLPIVVIVDARTRACAEVLAVALRQEHGAVILGEPTRGLPFPLRPVRLAGDVEVLLPEVPPGTPAAPLRPDVPVVAESGGSAGYPSVRGFMAEEEHDACVRQAVDLLTAICTFRQKHF